MMGNYSAYASYKDSGVEWLGEIPEHWQIIPIKFSLSMPITDGPHETPEILEDGIPFISAEAIKNDEIDFSKKRGFISDKDHHRFSKKYHPQYGDVYMVKSGATTGNVARVKTYKEFNIWSPLAVLRPHSEKSLTDFIFFVIKSKPFFYCVEQSWSFGTQQNIGMSVISNIRIAFPPLDEQRAIAAFLDYKTEQIDQLIAKKEALLEKLDEKRTALISQAVTKGLDPTVPMKDSGIEWLGKTPEHWDVTRAKFVSTVFVPQRNKPDLNLDEGFPWLTMEDMLADRVSKTSFKVDEESMKKAGSKILKKGAVISSCIGNFEVCAINDVDVIINQQLQAFIPNNILPEYLREIVGISSDYFKMNATAATVVYVNQSGFANLPVLMPPISEQKSIVCKCEEIKKDNVFLKQKISNAIQLLKEYRTALITNAVTGKIDVRSVPIPTP